MKDLGFSELARESVPCLSDRELCGLLEKLQPDADLAPQGEKAVALIKVIRAELLRRAFLQIEQQKRDDWEYKATIAG